MKRFLLFVGVAVAAMTVNAQKLSPVAGEKSLVFEHKPVLCTSVNKTSGIVGKNMSAIAANLQKAPAQEDIYGIYIEDAAEDIHVCSATTVSAATVDGKEYVKIVLDNEVISILGEYDAETGVINCGAQICDGGGNATGYHFEVYGIEGNNVSENLSFTVNEDKSLTCDQDGYIMYISDEGEYNGYTWDGPHWDPVLYKANGVQAGFQMGRSTSNEWVDFSYPVFIEDYEYSVNVYNYCALGCLAIDVNEDGTVSIPMGQPMTDMGFTDQNDIDTYGAYLCVHGVDLTADNKMQTNTDKEVTVGTISGNTITIDEYTRISTKFDEEGSGYAQNWYADEMTITLDEGNYLLGGTLGINDVKPTLEERAKNSKTYNLMGQQVNRKEAAKGILIRDGKKFINRK